MGIAPGISGMPLILGMSVLVDHYLELALIMLGAISHTQ